MPAVHNRERLISRAIGVLLVLVGIGFVALFVLLKLGGALSGDWQVSAFMLASGAVLMYVGTSFLGPPAQAPRPRQRDNLEPTLLKLRPVTEVLAGAGCALMSVHAVAAYVGIPWPGAQMLRILIVGPIVIGLFALRILVPGAFRTGVFSSELVNGWRAGTRIAMNGLLWSGWLGYLAIPVVWPDIKGYIPRPWQSATEGTASLMIAVLYASQVLILHWGRMRHAHQI